MAIQHEAITDPKIHEPKGITGAGANTVYVANGNGSGIWRTMAFSLLDTTGLGGFVNDLFQSGNVVAPQTYLIHAVIDNISEPGTIIIPIPESCTFTGAMMVLGNTITSANSIVTFQTASLASLGAATTITAAGSVTGSSFYFTATTNQNLVGPTFLRVTTDGGSTNAVPLYMTLYFET